MLNDDQLDVLRELGRIKLSAAPTVRDVYLAIAALGCHIKWNGEPGWQTLAHAYDSSKRSPQVGSPQSCSNAAVND